MSYLRARRAGPVVGAGRDTGRRAGAQPGPWEMKHVGEWRVRGLLLAFAAAAFVVGAVGSGVLWQSGYRALVSPSVLLPVAWVFELVVYLIADGRRSGRGPGIGLLTGLVARAAMAAATAFLWAEGTPWTEAFLRYYGSSWVGVVLQISMAALLVWFIADLAPAVAQLTAESRSTRPAPRGDRGRLLDELIRPESQIPPPVVPSSADAPAPAEIAEAPEVLDVVLDNEPAPEPDEEAEDEAPAPEPVPAAPGPPSLGARPHEDPEAVMAAVDEEPAPEEPQALEDHEDREIAVVLDREPPEAPEPPAAAPEPEFPEPVSMEEPTTLEQETSELEAVTDVSPQLEVVGWAVSEAVRNAVDVGDARPLAPLPGSSVLVVTNAPREVDEEAVARHCLTGAAALTLLVRHGLLGEPTMAAGLFRGGGMLVAPARDAMVLLHWGAPANLGLLAGLGRRLVGALQGTWPAAGRLPPGPALAEADPGEPMPALDEWARSLGQQTASHRVHGLGKVMTLASAGCEHRRAAAAAAALWQSWSEFGRACGHGGLRRLIVACDSGAAALGLVQPESGDPLLLVRLASQAQLGIAAAQVERLVQTLQAGSPGWS